MSEPKRFDQVPFPAEGAPNRRPAGMCRGPGHVIVYGNPAFVAVYGAGAIGLPARESLLDLPPAAFALLDAVLMRNKPLARWIRIGAEDWRLTVAPRSDPGTGEVYGVAFHIRARSDVPVVASELPQVVPGKPPGELPHYGPGRRFV